MSAIDNTCLICETTFSADKYDDNVCPKCGQVYNYDEGLEIALTKDQVECLRKLKRVNNV